jgi:hypothetical protein
VRTNLQSPEGERAAAGARWCGDQPEERVVMTRSVNAELTLIWSLRLELEEILGG